MDRRKPLTYCFDLDGTLCTTEGGRYEKAKPIPEAIERVNQLYEAGHRIIIDTARGSGTGQDYAELTRRQLQEWGLRCHELRCGAKIPADVYVDDRSLRPEEWLREVETCAS